jgi:hypothetical protein
MTKIEEAISAVRGEMRHIGLDPIACTTLDAERVLDDLGRKGVDAGKWFWSASDSQAKAFRKGWEKWLTSAK